MAIQFFDCKGFGQLEMSQSWAYRAGQVEAQCKLDPEKFAAHFPMTPAEASDNKIYAEVGAFLMVDKANKIATVPTAALSAKGFPMGINYSTEKIYNQFKEKLGCEFNYHIYGQEDTVKMLSNIIYDVAKINDEEFTRRMLCENIKTNTSLVSLTNESIPDDVLKNMNENIAYENEKNPMILSKISKEFIFSKSRFKDYKTSIQMKSNILKGVKDDGDMSFIKG